MVVPAAVRQLLPVRRAAHAGLIAAGFAVSGLFAYLTVRGIDLGRFRAALSESDFWRLVPAFAVLMVGVLLRAVRWRLAPECS